MNTRPIIDESTGPAALSASFNHDNSCFSVALETGFRIYSAKSCDLKVARDLGTGIGCAEMLHTTRYVALVGGGKQPKFPQNKVIIWNDSSETAALTLEFRTPVQRVRLSRTHIVVVLLNSVNLYRFVSPPQKVSTFETANNPFGLCCLGDKMMTFPGRTPGQVQLVELSTRNVSIIPAHSTPLRALELSRDGEVLATASETGTLVRVWSTANCTKLGEMRRGLDPATIFSLAISPNSTLLAVTSDKSTLHIFDVPLPKRPEQVSPDKSRNSPQPSGVESDSGPQNKWGMLAKIPLLPRTFSDTYSFASAHFEIGEEPLGWNTSGRGASKSPTWSAPIPGVPGGRPPKGLIGWLDDESLLVICAGQDARWEKFLVGMSQDGKRVCFREGWRKYME
ncbi:putative phosphatidylinositol 3,5-bisphosphate-binding protein [Lepidopterella palustris CBS 459.81]|uniref:Putative phosphatidylinositol 3,5-bisphosphate-binding protein n=1 Tax=Lepidopterella palustris CBS 459.81 TaxID=1314670 RepID=A0A8E2JJZ4_9PEZI|nr:putative phosphatidylinositol 3,5-bisphosphate-binding protein [Lepidopterella palustris CBS 459.81]